MAKAMRLSRRSCLQRPLPARFGVTPAIACLLLAFLAVSLSAVPAAAAWASESQGDSCGWAYLENDPNVKGGSRLVIQKQQRTDGEAYSELGAVPTRDEGEDLPWIDKVDDITAVSVRQGVKPVDTANWFSGCANLRSIDLSGLDMSHTRNTVMMFEGCSSLESIDLTGLDFSHVKEMAGLFAGCSSLRGLDLSGVDTSSATDMARIFSGCSKLASLDLSGFDTSHASEMSEMFSGCSSLTDIDLTGFKMASGGVDASYLFSGCKLLDSIDLSWCAGGTFSSASGMFKGCRALSKIAFPREGRFTIGNMDEMFFGCRSLRSVDLGSVATSSSESSENPASVFADSGIRKIVIGAGFTSEELLGSLFLLAAKWKVVDDSAECSSPSAMLDYVKDASGAVAFRGEGEPEGVFAYGDTQTNTLVLCSGKDELGSNRVVYGFASGDYVPWASSGDSIERVKIESPLAPESIAYWFSGCSQLTAFEGLENLDTSHATSMDFMFEGCASLTSLDVSGFDTSHVQSMWSMFSGCSSLTSLDVSGFDTSNVKSMWAMFSGCASLTSLDVSGFDTSSVDNFCDMFYGCSSLAAVDLSSFDTSRATELSSMFANCKSLASIDVSRFDIARAENLQGMFSGCASLESLDLSSFRIEHADRTGDHIDDDSYVNVTEMLDDCPALASIRVSKKMAQTPEFPAGVWKAADGADEYLYDQVPGGVSALWQRVSRKTFSYARLARDGQLRISHEPLDAGEGDELFEVLDSGYGDAADIPWHARLADVRSVVVGRGVRPRSTAFWFCGCTNLASVDLSGLNTKNVIDFTEMFYCCASLEELDLSNISTKKAESMRRMFHECRSLSRVTLGADFTFRGATWSRLAGSELPVGTWQELDGNGEPADASRAWASDSLPSFANAAFVKVDEATPGLVVVSVRGDADADDGKSKLTEKCTIETTYTVKSDGTLTAESSYELDKAYDPNVPLVVGGSAKASSTKTLSSRTVSSITLNKVSGDVHMVYLGPQVVEVKADAFASSPGVGSVKVRSPKLASRSRVSLCMRGSSASVYVPREWTKVVSAFKSYAWPRSRR